jgi:hypothetical protein
MQDFSVFASVEATPSGHCLADPPARKSLEWLKTQARFGVPVWAICTHCERSRLLDAGDLIAIVKPAAPNALADRMTCRACGGKACDLRAATPIPEYWS